MSQFTQGIATSREYIDHVDVMNQGRSWEGVEGLDKRLISQYIKKAQETVRGEHQIEGYVARLGGDRVPGFFRPARRAYPF